MDDKWFADKFIKISSKLSGIDTKVTNVDDKTEVLFEEVGKHEVRIRHLEQEEAVLEERSKWQRMKPYAIGGSIGTVSLGGLVTVAFAALSYLEMI